MMQEKPPQGKAVCWTLRLWSVAVISMLLLSVCFIASCKVTYQFMMDTPNRRLSKLHTYHSNLTCFSEGTMVSDKVWSCCPKDWKPFGSHCYFISTDLEASWNKSKEKCSHMGAHLVVIHSQEEQDFITGILKTDAGYFIGLLDAGDRQWQWIDQTPYKKSATFWHKGEPSNDYEKCVIINHRKSIGWGWNDIDCSDKENSVCQMKKIYL
ncbi:C-type lectin domain family 6 member A-like isoform X1 [Arvicanthis niloticus]|uniref:C-type lectin domain family 6 member A-like isoform X1 n=1 Tax=Arvicanthis niloticus TaxID=61156 RepID=UPI001486CCB1|nr:C-type lectin domain family 6 member A-like isoform X1 [Arvicanthis niloticus]